MIAVISVIFSILIFIMRFVSLFCVCDGSVLAVHR